jgi:hypothetical protein
VVPPASHRIPRVLWYSGYRLSVRSFGYAALTLYCWPSHAILLKLPDHDVCPQPQPYCYDWFGLFRFRSPLLAESHFDVFSSSYLDVSVQTVPHVRLFCSTHVDTVLPYRVSPFGNLRIKAHLQLPEAYRSLSRPSSAPDAKAFPLRSF